MTMVRAEWTKFRSVPGWVRGSAVAALLIVLFPLTGLGGRAPERTSPIPTGPDGQPVVDAFYFVHRPLAGDGRITVEVTSLTPVPWSKAGLILKAGPEPGARYAAIMVTGGHGVRMQHDFRHDRAGSPRTARWLRLTRSGDTITGEASGDGTAWSRVDTVRVPGLAATVEVGLFVACPQRAHGLGSSPRHGDRRFRRSGPDRRLAGRPVDRRPFPADPGALLRAEVGTAAVLAVTSLFALGVGAVLRRGAAAVTVVVASTVLPYLLALTPFVPPAMAQWLTRVTPAAALAVQQTLPRYAHVDSVYSPAYGYYPLPPGAGLAVRCGYTAVTVAVAVVVLRRRDV